MYTVFRTKRFDKELLKQFSEKDRKQVNQFEKKQLTKNPYVGDPLGYTFFREKKFKGKRVYYLIYEDLKCVLMIGISNKKTQQDTIDDIKGKLKEYHQVIKETLMQHDEFDPP